ncbi:MAG: Sb-PDE family phosphodiesterase [Bacteroidales bacterium]|nr:Sb-PDE family phosphodiesterase [Bacteroidales bacterium]
MRKVLLSISALCVSFLLGATVPHRAIIPDVPGYVTLKGDFHVHTVFSDDTTWPTVRVDEADYDGLDFLSITDHCDTRHQKMVNNGYFNGDKVDRNTSYELAAAAAKKYGIIVIHGAELTRGKHMFPGHFNTQFISDGNAVAIAAETACENVKDPIKKEEVAIMAGLKEAKNQGGFIVWNHPDWERQANNETIWWPIHTTVLEAGYMQGIEIVNRFTGYDPEAFHWAIEKGLTLVSGTDCHKPMFQLVDYERGEYRPMTLVFATERSEAGIKEALMAGRTAVFCDGCIYGTEANIKPLFEQCFTISDVKYSEKKVSFKVKNNTSIPLTLTKAPGSEKVVYQRLIYINEGEELTISINGYDNNAPLGINEFDVNFYVQNFLTDVDTPLSVSYHFSMPAKYRK